MFPKYPIKSGLSKLLFIKSKSKFLLIFNFFILIFLFDISKAETNSSMSQKNDEIKIEYLESKKNLEDYIYNILSTLAVISIYFDLNKLTKSFLVKFVLIYLIFFYLGEYIESEVNTNDGRLDAVIKTSNYIYILEFKLNKNAETALQQIKDKGYAEKYYGDSREKVLIGINFSSEQKTVDGWKCEIFK